MPEIHPKDLYAFDLDCRRINPELHRKFKETVLAAIQTDEARLVFLRELVSSNPSTGSKIVFDGHKQAFKKQKAILKIACDFHKVKMPDFSYLEILAWKAM
ncbi:MAG: hypothetical protein WCO10_01525 [bacterium]